MLQHGEEAIVWAESRAVWLEGRGQLIGCRLKDRRSGTSRDEGLTDPSWVESGAQDQMQRSS